MPPSGRLTTLQKDILVKATKSHARIRQMRNTQGFQMLDEDNWFARMHPLKGWNRKKCNKEFKKEYKRDGATTSYKNNIKKGWR